MIKNKSFCKINFTAGDFMLIFHRKSGLILFSGLLYALLITLTAVVFFSLGTGSMPYAAKELVSVASEITDFAIIFSFFAEIFIRRFEG